MNLTLEQIIAARDRARTKLARQRAALLASEAELQLWDTQYEHKQNEATMAKQGPKK